MVRIKLLPKAANGHCTIVISIFAYHEHSFFSSINHFGVQKNFSLLFVLFFNSKVPFGISLLYFTTVLLRFLLFTQLFTFFFFHDYYPECCLLARIFVIVCCPNVSIHICYVCTFLPTFLSCILCQSRHNSHFCSSLWKINVA